MTGVNTFGSDYSDGDLTIQNVNTLSDSGAVRNTSDMTVRMDHTSNFDSVGDASDLNVLFDDDYLLSGEETKSSIQLRIVNTYELAENDDPLTDFGSADFEVDGQNVSVDLTEVETYQDVADAINAELDELGIDGVEASTAALRTAVFTDDVDSYEQGETAGSYMPVDIVSTTGELEPGTIKRASDVADFDGLNTWYEGGTQTTEDPISVNVELDKVGRAGQGGNLVIGGKSQAIVDGQANGIEVFDISVQGDDSRPSSLGKITSTNDQLETINIATDSEFAGNDSVADLTVRGFDDLGQEITEDSGYNPFGEEVSVVNAGEFEGDLTIGTEGALNSYAQNVTLNASGSTGDVEYNANFDEGKVNAVNTGSGNDVVNLIGDGSAAVNTGAGDDIVYGDTVSVDVDAGAGNDAVYVDNSGITGGAVVPTAGLQQTAGGDLDSGYSLLAGREVTVTVNGFEATATVEANNVDGAQYLTNQTDLNDAVISAVANSEVLSDLVTVTDSGELLFTSKIDGVDNTVDISVGESDWTDNQLSSLESEYQDANNDSTLTVGNQNAVEGAETTLDGGEDSTASSANSVTLGSGEDTIVLSTSENTSDTILFDGSFGESSIVNFDADTDGMNFNAILDNMKSNSGSQESEERIDTVVQQDSTLSANEVNVQSYNGTDDLPFANLTASNLVDAIGDLSTGSYTNADNSVELVGNNGTSVVMVQNEDNPGEYKAFEVNFDGGADDGKLSDSSISDLGTLDLGGDNAADADAAVEAAVQNFIDNVDASEGDEGNGGGNGGNTGGDENVIDIATATPGLELETYSATDADDIFALDIEAAQNAEENTTQFVVDGFDAANDSFDFNLAEGEVASGDYQLDELVAQTDFTNVYDGLNDAQIVNLGYNQDGDVVNMQLNGVEDLSTVDVAIA